MHGNLFFKDPTWLSRILKKYEIQAHHWKNLFADFFYITLKTHRDYFVHHYISQFWRFLAKFWRILAWEKKSAFEKRPQPLLIFSHSSNITWYKTEREKTNLIKLSFPCILHYHTWSKGKTGSPEHPNWSWYHRWK